MTDVLLRHGWPLLASVAVKSLFVLALAGLVVLALRRASAAARHLVWSLTLLGLLLLPLFSSALPATWQVPLGSRALLVIPDVPTLTPTPAIPNSEGGGGKAGSVSGRPAGSPLPKTGSPFPPPSPELGAGERSIPWQVWVCGGWLAGAVLTLLPSLIGLAGVRRLTRRSSSLTVGPLPELATSLAQELRVRSPVRLLLGEAGTPMTWGWLRPVILLPLGADQWPPDRLRAVLLHELAHIARADWPAQMASHLACAIYWFNPLVWLAARQARTEGERACDDRVLLAGIPAPDYARHLLDVARSLRDTPLPAVLPMAHTPQMAGRLKAILGRGRTRNPVTRRALVLAALALAVVVAPLAAMQTEPQSLKQALTWPGRPNDTPAGEEANIAFLKSAISKFGDADPWVGKAYYVLGENQFLAGHSDEAVKNFQRSLKLPEPPYADSGIHASARYELVLALQSSEHYGEALDEAHVALASHDGGPPQPEFLADLRGWIPELQKEKAWADDQAASKDFYGALPVPDHAAWTRTLSKGVTAQLVAVLTTQGDQHWAYDPDGRLLRRSKFPDRAATQQGVQAEYPDRYRTVSLIVRLTYGAGRVVKTSYQLPESSGCNYESGISTENGVVMTNETQINPLTDGLRLVAALFPAAQRQATLRVGVAAGTPTALPPDAPSPTYEWATFTGITLPPIKP